MFLPLPPLSTRAPAFSGMCVLLGPRSIRANTDSRGGLGIYFASCFLCLPRKGNQEDLQLGLNYGKLRKNREEVFSKRGKLLFCPSLIQEIFQSCVSLNTLASLAGPWQGLLIPTDSKFTCLCDAAGPLPKGLLPHGQQPEQAASSSLSTTVHRFNLDHSLMAPGGHPVTAREFSTSSWGSVTFV